MSRIATTATTTADHLVDYRIRLTGGDELQSASTQETPNVTAPLENPPGWETEYRQVPPYRPINTQLDRESRPWGSDSVESVIIFTMFQGVWLKSSVAWLWRVTGGRLNEKVFTSTIGGES
ncbi:hypothetical protein OQA88_3358 [Cercophora sp. LCS_1]